MRKTPRKRRTKRSGASQESQRRQKLSKKVQELYVPSVGNATEEDWHSELDAELDLDLETATRFRKARVSRPSREGKHDETPPLTSQPSEVDRRGTVISITSGACRIEADDEVYDCILPSELARDQRAAVAVGDQVLFTGHGEHSHRVCNVLPRQTFLSRPDPQNPHRERVVAANIDIAVHVASVIQPPLRPALIDRYLIAIERGGAKPILCVNKIDLFDNNEQKQLQLQPLEAYRNLGCDICLCSTLTGEGLETLRSMLAQRTAVFVGHSGVGKSSLLNALAPEARAATGAVNATLGTGRHTTTRSSLYWLGNGTRVIDTPGIREFGLWKLTQPMLRSCFPEFDDFAQGCRFNDCGHTHEPRCAVREAVAVGKILDARYQTYLRIRLSLKIDLDRA